MASGWNENHGECISGSLSDLELSTMFSKFYSSQSRKTNSYKYGLIKSLLDNLYNVDQNLKLSFEAVFTSFAEVYWNLVLKFSLRQNSGEKNAKISQILPKLYSSFGYSDEVVPFESLKSEYQLEVASEVLKECSKYVVGALFGDFSKDGLGCLYAFSKEDKTIQFHKDAYRYLCQKKTIIEKVNFFEWARFIEKVNNNGDNCNALLNKLDESNKRTNLEAYWEILYDQFGYDRCFYCGCRLVRRGQVDHLIPWSFVRDDKLYNFVLACKKCNIAKKNSLPEYKRLSEVISRNRHLISNGDHIEQRYRINTSVYTDKTLCVLYEAAIYNGYDRVFSSPHSIEVPA